ncbi:MAG TPA: hypothetical protein VFV87_10335 [Pirellulaceae bacterium]|nr:hypothetical protein [Pirellulaceae bacterium]
MERFSAKDQPRTRLGCGFLLLATVITCVMLTINGLIVTNAYYTIVVSTPPGTIHPRVGQAIVFLGPVLLLFVEWWAFDVATDWLHPRSRQERAAKS